MPLPFGLSLYEFPAIVFGFLIIIVGYIKLRRIRKVEFPDQVQIFDVWLLGIIAFLLGFFGQVAAMLEAFELIAEAGDISPSLVASGIRETFKPLLTGIAVLIVSLIAWGILKKTKNGYTQSNS